MLNFDFYKLNLKRHRGLSGLYAFLDLVSGNSLILILISLLSQTLFSIKNYGVECRQDGASTFFE